MAEKEQTPTELLPDISVDETPNPTTVDTENETGISSLSSIGTSQVFIAPNEQHVVDHPCFEVLKSGRRGNMKNMNFRIELMHSLLKLEPSTYIQSPYCKSTVVKFWYKKISPYLNHPKKWNREVMAMAICEFDQVMENACNMAEVEESPSKLPPPLTEFYTYILEVREIAEIAKTQPIMSKKSRIGSQAVGKRLQDTIDMNNVTREKLDFSNCANCKHNYVLPISPDELEINAHNDNVKCIYRNAMYAYNHRSRSRRGDRKPTMGRSMSRKLACLCSRMNCLGRMDGVGCLKCEWACIEFKKAERKSRPYFDENLECQCKICECTCDVVYFRSEEKKLATQAKEDTIQKLDTKLQTKIDGFYGFQNAIVDLAKNRVHENNQLSDSSLLGLTPGDLLHSIEMQTNVNLRNALQKSTGSIDDFKLKSNDGKVISLAAMRREKNTPGSHVYPIKKRKGENNRIIIEDNITLSSSPSIDLTRSNCYYNNRLSTSQINLQNELNAENPPSLNKNNKMNAENSPSLNKIIR